VKRIPISFCLETPAEAAPTPPDGDDVLLGKTDDDWIGTWEWSYSTFDFSPYASGNPARIALRYVGNDGAKIGVDDILITCY
jgi:hypothetical protein